MIGGVGAKFTFSGFQITAVLFIVDHERSSGGIRALLDTGTAADTFFDLHNPSDIAEARIHFQGLFRAGGHTGRVDALSTLFDGQVMGPFVKGILNDLYSGQGKILNAFVH